MKVEIIKEIDSNHMIIKYSFENVSEELDEDDIDDTMDQNYHEEAIQTTFYMLISYQVIGSNQDLASISMFEFDIETNNISPSNFVIVTQKITKNTNVSFSSHNSHKEVNFIHGDLPLRTLSVVAEDMLENESNSFSMKQHNFLNRLGKQPVETNT